MLSIKSTYILDQKEKFVLCSPQASLMKKIWHSNMLNLFFKFPCPGWIKLNFDVCIGNANSMVSVLAHNDKGEILLAFTNIVTFTNPVVVEVAALLASALVAWDSGFNDVILSSPLMNSIWRFDSFS